MTDSPTRQYEELGNYTSTGTLLVREGIVGPGAPVVYTEGNPNGVVTGVVGQLMVDQTTGTIYQNTDDGTTWVTLTSVFSSAATTGSTGAHGALVFDGVATVAGLVPAGGAYTLVEDLAPSSMTVNAGVVIVTAAFRIFVQGTLTNNGTITNSGGGGGNGGAGINGGAGSGWSNVFSGPGIGGVANQNSPGGDGAAVVLLARVAGYVNVATQLRGATGNPGGNGLNGDAPGRGGGGGGTAFGQNGGNAGTLARHAANMGGQDLSYLERGCVVNEQASSNFSVRWMCSSGGGGGASLAGISGGGGGAGGGVIFIRATTLAGSGVYVSRGGNGGNGWDGGGGNVCGGGGGGGGGLIVLCGKRSGLWTTDVLGGTGGLGRSSGGVTSGGGGNGAAGLAFVIS